MVQKGNVEVIRAAQLFKKSLPLRIAVLLSLLVVGTFALQKADAVAREDLVRKDKSIGKQALIQPASLAQIQNNPQLQWWQDYHDPQLNRLMDEALANNPTVQIAADRIQQGRSMVLQSLASEFPLVSFEPGFNRQQNSKTLTVPSTQQFSSSGPRLFAPGQTVNIYTFPLKASYELDYLLRKRDQTRAQSAGLLNLEAQARSAVLGLTTEVATAYFNWVRADAAVEVLKQQLEKAQVIVAIEEAQYDSGMIPFEPVLVAQNTVSTVKTSLTASVQTAQIALTHLHALLGRPVTGASPNHSAEAERPPLERLQIEELQLSEGVNALSIPSERLSQRPDIQADEALIQQARLELRAARKAFYPSLTLSGQFGFATTRLRDLFSWDSHLATVASGLAQSVIDGGAKVAQARLKKWQYEERLHHYHETVLTAFEEMNTALIRLKSAQEIEKQQNALLESARQSEALVTAQVEQGLLPEKEKLSAETQTLSQKLAAVNQQLQCLLESVSLYKAAGGKIE